MSLLTLLELARRQRPSDPETTSLEALRAGAADAEVVRTHGLPPATVRGVRSFYELLEAETDAWVCTGTACRFRPGFTPPAADELGVRCLGRCYDPPARTTRMARPIPRTALITPAVLRHLVDGAAPVELPRLYARPSGDDILDRLAASGLRGRGGAAYPTAAKWRIARATERAIKYVVANGDEGDPGSFVDRLLLEDDPHAVLAGMAACAAAIGATHGVIYIRAEYPVAAERMRAAIATATTGALLPAGFAVEVRVGAGSYVCGEETALLRSIEGLRGEAQPKPPYPAERGLFGRPTIVQNVETLAMVTWILETGARPASKAFSASGAVARPGAIEAAFGTSLRTLLDDGAGGPVAGARWRMALVGGPMGRVVPASAFDIPLDYDQLPGLGHGGIVVFDDRVTPRALAEHLFAFAASESCGACTPCRVGTAQLATRRDRAALARLLDTLELGSLCGFGQGVPRPIRDLLAHFPAELFA